MSTGMIVALAGQLSLASILFFLVNWVGKHAVDFGYTSTTLFEESTESIALNFFLRAISPAVFIIGISAALVYCARAEWRLGIHHVAVYYYLLRASAICLLNRQHLISWTKFALHSGAGIVFAFIAYRQLILPNRSLLPNLEAAGNELWLAIFAFLYAVANKIELSTGPGARRRNQFVRRHYRVAVERYGALIDRKIADQRLKLLTYAVLIYEDYARPPAVRELERLMFWKSRRTTGVMQVAADHALSDQQSVIQGTGILLAAWQKTAVEVSLYDRMAAAIVAYNADDDYVSHVFDVMEILAKRVEPGFRLYYDEIYE